MRRAYRSLRCALSSDSLRIMCTGRLDLSRTGQSKHLRTNSTPFCIRSFALCLSLSTQLMLAPACSKKPSARHSKLPPSVPVDLEHWGKFKADREFSFSNIILVWQPGSTGSGGSAITLTSDRPLPDGSQFRFVSIVQSASLEQLKSERPDLAGGPLFDIRSSGVFTPLSSYQPKLVRIEITEIGSTQVSGSISGEFYEFNTMQTANKPTVTESVFTFRAKLIDRSNPAPAPANPG